MLSRVANNLFWLDRYMERSNGLLNLIKTNYLSNQEFKDNSSWNRVTQTYFGKSVNDLNISEDNYTAILQYMMFNKKSSNTIIDLIKKSRQNARSVQEHISKELWLNINKYFLHINNKNLPLHLIEEDPILIIDELLKFNMLHYSNSDINQERGNAYCFMNLGKYLERLFQSIDFLLSRLVISKSKMDDLEENLYWKTLLTSIGGYQQYVRTYKSVFHTENVMQMIVLNPYFPRSIYYCLKKLSIHIERLNNFNNINSMNDLSFLIGKLESNLRFTKIENLKQIGLEKFLIEMKVEIQQLSDEIDTVYFNNLYQINT